MQADHIQHRTSRDHALVRPVNSPNLANRPSLLTYLASETASSASSSQPEPVAANAYHRLVPLTAISSLVSLDPYGLATDSRAT
jgi:hypothetical protein